MAVLGAHLSIAGGLPRAVDRAEASRCDALQIFTKSAGQWRARVLPPEEISRFRQRVDETGIHPVVAHNSYLINIATASPALRARSILALGDELDRAAALGLQGLVMHPGSYTTGNEGRGLELIAEAIADLLRSRPRITTMILLEQTAGQGTNLGHRFEHLAAILERLDGSPRVGVCLDTCHLLAAGYDVCSPEGYAETFEQFGRLVGFERLKLFHLNDSKKPLGSRVDRHEHIGRGHIGVEGFTPFMRDKRWRVTPKILETAKGKADNGREWDAINLETLKSLM